jgi:hypothetical protein
MGLAPEWRGQGHGAAVLAALIERARAAGVARIQLEVLEENTPAHRLYERLGFVDVRPLLIYNGRTSLPHGVATAEADEEVRVLPVDEALVTFDAMHAASLPCWQRELPSLHHMAGGLHARGLAGPDGGLRAYVLFSRTGSGIAVLDAGTNAPTAAERARHVGALVRALTEHAPRSALRAINVPPGDPLGDVMDALGCAVASRQREMALPLAG